MAVITLQIDPCGPPDSPEGWLAVWSLVQQPIVDPVAVTGPKARMVNDLSQQFLGLFEQPGQRPMADTEALRALGRTLFDAWLGPVWPALATTLAGPGPHELRVSSSDRDVLNLPWELIELDSGRPIGCDAAWTLWRSPPGRTITPDGPLRAGPLRILFLAAAPVDQPQLDYEREEDAMLQATARLRGAAVVHFTETGGFEELAELVAECRPHVVHLSGHGRVDDRGRGTFAFEDERGRTDSRGAETIVAEVFRGSTARLVFFNGCQTSQAAVSGLCQALVAAGVPLTLGWSASVADDRAIDFVEAFYRRLVHGEHIPTAAAHARELIRRKGLAGQLQDASFALPHLYSGSTGGALFDASASPEPYAGPRTEYALLGDGIKGLRTGFVGRRREVQLLLPALRDGDTTFAVLTGIGGAGKSTLATRAANRLCTDGFRVVPIRTPSGPSPAQAAKEMLSRLVGALDQEFLRAGRDDLHHLLTDGNLALGQRLPFAIDGLNELRLMLVLDNFEDALELESRRIADAELARFYAALATDLTRGSRVLVTCRYLPAETPAGQPTVLHLPLPEFPEHDFLKFLRRNEDVNRRIHRGELTPGLLAKLYRAIGGTPGFLDQLRNVLRTADANELLEELEGGESGRLGAAREAYCQKILASRLYQALSPEGRVAARRLALSELPLPIDAVALVTGGDQTQAGTALEEGVSYGLVQRFDELDVPVLYHSPALLRPWLSATEELSEQDTRGIHGHLAAFWQANFQSTRVLELGVSIDTGLAACREHSQNAEDGRIFQWATIRLAKSLSSRSEWLRARELLEEIPISERGAETWYSLASIDLDQGIYLAAREKFDRALQMTQDLGEHAGEAAIWLAIASIDEQEGRFPEAREKFARGLGMFKDLGVRAGQAVALEALAWIDIYQGHNEAARKKHERALELETLYDPIHSADTWHNFASLELVLGEHTAARDKLERALKVHQTLGDRRGEAAVMHELGVIDLKQGVFAGARDKLERALQTLQDIDDRAGEAHTWHNLADLDFRQGNYAAARIKSKHAMKMMRTLGNRRGKVKAWIQLAMIDMEQDKPTAARRKFERVYQLVRALGLRPLEASTWRSLAIIDMHQGDYHAARDKFQRSLQMWQALSDREQEAESFSEIGFLAHKNGNSHGGIRLLAVHWLIKQEIISHNVESQFRLLSSVCRKMSYDQAQFDAMITEADEGYRKDRGWTLIEQAFAEP